jgi:hypothetical protein
VQQGYTHVFKFLSKAMPLSTNLVPIQSVSDFDVSMEISSVMEDVDDDDDTPTPATPSLPNRSTSSSLSSHFSSSSLSSSVTPLNLLPKFDRTLEQARHVVFHPSEEATQVHEFDWKVDFVPATTTGHKRKYTEDVEMGNGDDMATRNDATVVSIDSSSQSSQRQSFKKALNFWKNLSSQNSTNQKDGSSGSERSSSSTNMRRWSQSTIVGDDSSISSNCLSTTSSKMSALHNMMGSNPFCATYSRPAKRTRMEANYHLGPSSDRGILKNRMTPPDAIMLNETIKRRGVAATSSLFGQTSAPQFHAGMVTPSPPHRHHHHSSTHARRSSLRNQQSSIRKKQIRFVDSRVTSVKRLQSGNLFSFGNRPHQQLHDDDDEEEEDNQQHASSPQSAARTIRRLQSGTMSNFARSSITGEFLLGKILERHEPYS